MELTTVFLKLEIAFLQLLLTKEVQTASLSDYGRELTLFLLTLLMLAATYILLTETLHSNQCYTTIMHNYYANTQNLAIV